MSDELKRAAERLARELRDIVAERLHERALALCSGDDYDRLHDEKHDNAHHQAAMASHHLRRRWFRRVALLASCRKSFVLGRHPWQAFAPNERV